MKKGTFKIISISIKLGYFIQVNIYIFFLDLDTHLKESTNLKNLRNALTPRVKVKVAQLCLTLYDPMDYRVHGILQARILEWVAVPFSRGFSQPRDQTQVSRIAGGFFTS